MSKIKINAIREYDKIIAFTKSKLPYGWMGNMCGFWKGEPLIIKYGGKVWNTSENLFQAMRFSNPKIREKIRRANGYVGKKIAKDINNIEHMTVTPLSQQDIDNMYDILVMKVEQHPILMKELLAIPDDFIIIEDVSTRRGGSGLFWGAANIDGTQMWAGYNVLGELWMKVRNKFKK